MFDDLQVRERLRIALEKNTQLEEELNTTKEEVRFFKKNLQMCGKIFVLCSTFR